METSIRPHRPPLRTMIRRWLAKIMPLPWYVFLYQRTSGKIKSSTSRQELFDRFLSAASGPCLQIAVKDEYGVKFGPNWTSVDKYDYGPAIDRHDDVEALDFPDAAFNAVVCWSVLEHVPHPQRAIAEMLRVLRPGGTIWVQLPFLLPYHADPHDYWRVTPSGLRVWMRDFEEVACGCDYWARTHIVCATFFYGRKPEAAEKHDAGSGAEISLNQQ